MIPKEFVIPKDTNAHSFWFEGATLHHVDCGTDWRKALNFVSKAEMRMVGAYATYVVGDRQHVLSVSFYGPLRKASLRKSELNWQEVLHLPEWACKLKEIFPEVTFGEMLPGEWSLMRPDDQWVSVSIDDLAGQVTYIEEDRKYLFAYYGRDTTCRTLQGYIYWATFNIENALKAKGSFRKLVYEYCSDSDTVGEEDF